MVWKSNIKLLFIHIPKTGGDSIESWLFNKYIENGYGLSEIKNKDFNYINRSRKNNKRALHHLTIKEVEYIFKKQNDKLDQFFKFSICRNPYQRFISEFNWRYIKKDRKTTITSKISKEEKKKIRSKQDYLNLLISNCSKEINCKPMIDKYSDHLFSQSKFIFNENHKLMINKLFYLEDFNECIDYIKLKYNIEKKYIQKNRSKKIIENLNETQKKQIFKIYKIDFYLFNYDPELLSIDSELLQDKFNIETKLTNYCYFYKNNIWKYGKIIETKPELNNDSNEKEIICKIYVESNDESNYVSINNIKLELFNSRENSFNLNFDIAYILIDNEYKRCKIINENLDFTYNILIISDNSILNNVSRLKVLFNTTK